jgi:hypothetical protein
MNRLIRQLRLLLHNNSVAGAFIRWAYEKERLRMEWDPRTLFRQLRERDPAITEPQFRDFFRNVLPTLRLEGGALCHFPAHARKISFHAAMHELVQRVMRPGRPPSP